MDDGNHPHADDLDNGTADHADAAAAIPVPQESDIHGYDDDSSSEQSLIPQFGGLDDGYDSAVPEHDPHG